MLLQKYLTIVEVVYIRVGASVELCDNKEQMAALDTFAALLDELF